MKKLKPAQSGFTLIEILITLTVLVLLAVLFLIATRGQISKARDAKRKSDLNKIQKVVEDYYSDHGAYPDGLVCGDTSGTPLAAYIKEFPCDPINSDEYYYSYAYDFTTAKKMWFKVYAKLENYEDPIISELGCLLGCGDNQSFNYYVSSNNIIGSQMQTNEMAVNYATGYFATPTPTLPASPVTPTSTTAPTLEPTPTSGPTTPTLEPTPTYVDLPDSYVQCFADSACSSAHADVPEDSKDCGWGCSGTTKMCLWANPAHTNTVCCYNTKCPAQ